MQDDEGLTEPPAPRRLDGRTSQAIRHRGPRDPHDERGQRQRQRQRGQGQVVRAIPQALAEAERRKPAQPRREHQNQDDPGHVGGDRRQEQGAAGQDYVGDPPLANGGRYSRRNSEQQDDDQRVQRQLERRNDPGLDNVPYRRLIRDGLPEVAPQDSLEPGPILDQERVVEAIAVPQCRNLLGCDPPTAEEDLLRAARCYPDEREDEKGSG